MDSCNAGTYIWTDFVNSYMGQWWLVHSEEQTRGGSYLGHNTALFKIDSLGRIISSDSMKSARKNTKCNPSSAEIPQAGKLAVAPSTRPSVPKKLESFDCIYLSLVPMMIL
jgi:hypothetical protein